MTKKTILFNLLIAMLTLGGMVDGNTVHASENSQADAYTAEIDDSRLYHIIRKLPSEKRDDISVSILSKGHLTKQDEQILMTIEQTKADDTLRDGIAKSVVSVPIIALGMLILLIGLAVLATGVKNQLVKDIKKIKETARSN